MKGTEAVIFIYNKKEKKATKNYDPSAPNS
jgi:hypothetical protein